MPSARSRLKAHTATRQTTMVQSCFWFADEASHLLEPAQARAQLALRHGGLDAWCAIARRDPDFAHEVAGSLASDRPLPLALPSARDARDSLSAIDFEPTAGRSCSVLQCQPNPKSTRPLTSLAVSSERPAAQAVDNFCHEFFFLRERSPCWTCRLGLMLRAFSPPVPPCRSSHWSRRASKPFPCADFACPRP